jgi:HK97 family phage prohead protease
MDQIEYRAFEPDLVVRAPTGGSYDGRIIEGIAIPYGKVQRINDELTEVFAPGAFAHQVGAPFRVKFARGHQSKNGELIGRALELREEPGGLWGAFLVSDTQVGRDTLALVRDRALDELSIGFTQPKSGAVRRADGVVERTKANLFEVSIVPEGAYGRGAKVLATRAEERDSNVRGLRDWLAEQRRAAAALPELR